MLMGMFVLLFTVRSRFTLASRNLLHLESNKELAVFDTFKTQKRA